MSTEAIDGKWAGTGGELRPVHASLVGERLNPRAFGRARRLQVATYVVPLGDDALALLFRYGVVVTVGASEAERKAFLAELATVVHEPYETPIEDTAYVRIDPAREDHVGETAISLCTPDIERLIIVSDVLSKSVVLEHFETRIGDAFERLEPFAAKLVRTGRGTGGTRDLIRHIGRALLIQHRTIWRAGIEEKPDVLWDNPALERLYAHLQDEYEIRERNLALSKKIELLSTTAGTLANLVQDSRSYRVEWYIVLLIVAEIAMSLIEKLAR